MIQFKSLRQYTHVVNGLRFPRSTTEPFVLVYFSENSNLTDDYPKLNIRTIDARVVVVPVTKIPRTILTGDLRKVYRSFGLLPLSIRQKVPLGQNIILDLSQYLTALDTMLKPKNYRQRAGFLIKNILSSTLAVFPNNYQKTLIYTVDTTKDLNPFISRKIFPIVQEMKNENYTLFDNMILNLLSPSGPKYRLLIKDQDYKFQRVVFYMRTIKTQDTEEEIESDSNQAANIIVKALDKDLEPGSKMKVKGAIEDYLTGEPEKREKVVSGDANASDIQNIATTSILYGVSGDLPRAQRISNSIPKNKKMIALKAINKGFADELLKPEKTVSLSTDPRVEVYNTPELVGNKSPEHVYQKRQLDFEINLKNDLTNAFKVLEVEEIPLQFKDISISQKKTPAGEILKSDINIAKISLVDKFGNAQNVAIELPRIDPNTGTFRLNGRKKSLINQIVQCPITFPKPGESRFESSYSTFRIHSKNLRNVKFLEGFMGSKSYKLPLLILLSFAFGFDDTMKLYKIGYEITTSKPDKDSVSTKVNKTDYIVFKNVDSDLKKELCMSLIHAKVYTYDVEGEFGSLNYFENLIIAVTGRLNSTFLISSNIKYVVDPVVRQVLRNQQLPSELNLIMKYMAERVVDKFLIQRNDLSNQRIRNSEVLVHLAQKQIRAAYTTYKEQVLSGNKDATFVIQPTKVISDFLNTELVVNMEYANPTEEMSTMTRVSPVGKKVGGIPDHMAIVPEARNIHESYFGNIDPLDTPEGPNIGLIQQLTIDALISSSRGLFAAKDFENKEGTGMLSTSSSMIPFLENVAGARVIMITNQAKQTVPLKDPEAPVVQSGYESILTKVLSGNFVKKSPCTGKVSKITIDSISIKCGTKTQSVDITPLHLKSGSGKNTLSVFNPIVKVGSSVKKDDLIAEGACMSNGSISLGRSLLAAIMPYKGYNFEDGVVISEKVVSDEKLTSLHGIEEEILISENDRVLYLASIGEKVEKGKPILRKTIGEIEQLIGFDEDDTTTMSAGQYVKKSPGGRIVDIQVYSNLDEDKFPQLKALINRTDKKFGRKSKENFKIAGQTIKGISIKFVIEQELKITVSDKICNRYGNKGIVSLIEKDDLMPRTPFGEKIEIVLNPLGITGRMNPGQIYEIYCGLMAKELGKRIPDLTRAKTISLIKQVYGQLDTSKNRKNTETLVRGLSNLSKSAYDKLVYNVKKSGFYPIIIPPFQAPGHKSIRSALKMLGLKSAYYLTLPEYNTKTKSPVPVGYMYIYKLEHLGEAKIYGRSTGPVTGKISQPTSGKQRDGGQRLGELDTYSFISYNCPNVLAEFMGPLSDDYITREEILAEIIQTGAAKYKEPKVSPARDLLNSYFVSLMLGK